MSFQSPNAVMDENIHPNFDFFPSTEDERIKWVEEVPTERYKPTSRDNLHEYLVRTHNTSPPRMKQPTMGEQKKKIGSMVAAFAKLNKRTKKAKGFLALRSNWEQKNQKFYLPDLIHYYSIMKCKLFLNALKMHMNEERQISAEKHHREVNEHIHMVEEDL